MIYFYRDLPRFSQPYQILCYLMDIDAATQNAVLVCLPDHGHFRAAITNHRTGPADIDALVMSLDVKTLPELETAFGTAWKMAKGHDQARAKLKANYDEMKQAIQAGTI